MSPQPPLPALGTQLVAPGMELPQELASHPTLEMLKHPEPLRGGKKLGIIPPRRRLEGKGLHLAGWDRVAWKEEEKAPLFCH